MQKLVWVADFFEDELGGAELTSAALMSVAPPGITIIRIKSEDVTAQMINSLQDVFWLFGNFSRLDRALYDQIMAKLNYSIIEFDYKYCAYRNPEVHAHLEPAPCDCAVKEVGKKVLRFMDGARTVFVMSEKQVQRYDTILAMLEWSAWRSTLVVISSAFTHEDLTLLSTLRCTTRPGREYMIMQGKTEYQRWQKGTDQAIAYAKEHRLPYRVVGQINNHAQFLRRLARSKGIILMPNGRDTCPRVTIEARLMGREAICGPLVEHKDERWFSGSPFDIEQYILGNMNMFWRTLTGDMEHGKN